MIINNKISNNKKVNKAIKITKQTKKNKNSIIKKIIRIKIINKPIKRNRIQINKINKRRNKK
jgi:hypothetical protein